MNLTVTSEYIGNCIVFELQGKILSEADADSLRDAISAVTVNKVVFDIKSLTHINSTGIAVFVKTMTKCRIESGDLLICSPNKIITTLFQITKMNEVFSMHDSRESALNFFK